MCVFAGRVFNFHNFEGVLVEDDVKSSKPGTAQSAQNQGRLMGKFSWPR